jgi:sodium-dependent dicarboxylate transporter 2/3/5
MRLGRRPPSPTLPAVLDRKTLQWAGLLGGPVLAGVSYALLAPGDVATGGPSQLDHAGRATAALGVWMATWWLTEAIPVYATAFLPLVVLPLTGARSIGEASSAYGDPLIFLFLGGFVLALSLQRWGLDRRIALVALEGVGTAPRRMVLGFMAVTAFLSMWVSNTATTIMMLPIATSVIDVVARKGRLAGTGAPLPDSERRNFSVCLLLGIAYASSIGGLATLVGTPPNLFLASFLRGQLGIEISFARWMAVGLPLALLFLPVCWWLLTHALYPLRAARIEGIGGHTRAALQDLGPVRRGEWTVLAVAACTAGAWVLRPVLVGLTWGEWRPLAGLTDTGIAVGAALVLFAIPLDWRQRVFAIDWETAEKLPWGLLVLFGGGLSLAAAIRANGVGEWMGHQVQSLAGMPDWVLVLFVTTSVIFLTELTSNTATAATLIPILAGLAPGLGVEPLLLLVPAAIAASCAFMLPVATPPNAIVFGSGLVTVPQMSRAGIWLNLCGVAIITACAFALAAPILGAVGAAAPAAP